MSVKKYDNVFAAILFIAVCVFLLVSSGVVVGYDKEPAPAAENSEPEKKLSLRLPSAGKALLTGDFAAGDKIELYSREYRSADNSITDKLLLKTTADKARSVSLLYNLFTPPLSEEKVKPDFQYKGADVVLTALYAVVSDGNSGIRSDLAYVSGFLDSGVVSQYWCTYGGNTACGAAAGAIAMQMVYPAHGDDLYTRVNTMRNYCMDGTDYCTGYPMYEDVGEQVANTVNRFITEELSGDMLMTDHRTKGKSTEETLIELVTTGRPAVIEVCYLRGFVMDQYWGYSHFITINGFFLESNGYWFRYSDPVTVSYASVSSDLIEKSNQNVSYMYLPGYTYDRYIGALSDPLFSIE